jgi:hypothetical protein
MAKIETLNWISKKLIRKKKVPDVFRETIFDKLLVLVLVKTHKNSVISCLWSGFEVEHHLSFLFKTTKNNSE